MSDSAEKPSDSWLRLSEAADYLGVHFTTLRRWADDGKVPCIRTPGGRRRFKREELAAFLDGQRQQATHPTATTVSESLPAVMEPPNHDGIREEPWYGQLDEVQRTAMRADGQQLMAVLMQYASRTQGGDAFLEEGQRLAAHYGEICHSVGLSLMEAVRAFVLVRRSIADAIYEAGALVGPSDQASRHLYRRTNHFLDTVLLSILEAFEEARSRAAPNDPPASS